MAKHLFIGLALCTAISSANAQDGGTCKQQVNDGDVSSQTIEDIGTFNTLIYERLTVPGIPPDAASFQFTDSCPSSDFFSPVRAANEMMALLGLTSASGCSILGDLDTGSQLTLTTDQWNTVYEYLSEGRIVTNIVTQPEETLIVIDLVANAPSDDDVFVSVEGNHLIVTGLDPISAPPGLVHWPLSAQNISAETNAMILGLLQNSHNIVDQILDSSAEHALTGPDPQPGYGVHHTQALLLGGAANGHPTRADLVENALALYLQNTFPLADVTVDHIDAVWGVYGILPLAVVSAPDAYLLVDTTNGQVAGPFEPGSNLYADDLLALHSNVFDSASTKPVYMNRLGCNMLAPPRWTPTPPPGWVPAPATPGVPPTSPPGRPTHWTNYDCVPIGFTGLCKCTSEGSGTGGTPPTTIKTRVVCTCSVDANNDCAPNGNPGDPMMPPSPPTTPRLLPNCTCGDQQWLY